jgi:hypothetical protein
MFNIQTIALHAIPNGGKMILAQKSLKVEVIIA